jgi:hypothetical protein
MSVTRRLICVAYAAIAVAALFATWSQNLAYFSGGATNALALFIADTRVNPASRSITLDIGLFLLAAAIFMFVEARRLGIRLVWLYLLFGFLIAISVTFPLFMIARERALAKAGEPAASLTAIDIAGVVATGALVLGLSVFILAG